MNSRIDTQSILGYRLPRDVEISRVKISSLLTIETLSRLHEQLLDIEIELKNSKDIGKEALLYTSFIKLHKDYKLVNFFKLVSTSL